MASCPKLFKPEPPDLIIPMPETDAAVILQTLTDACEGIAVLLIYIGTFSVCFYFAAKWDDSHGNDDY